MLRLLHTPSLPAAPFQFFSSARGRSWEQHKAQLAAATETLASATATAEDKKKVHIGLSRVRCCASGFHRAAFTARGTMAVSIVTIAVAAVGGGGVCCSDAGKLCVALQAESSQERLKKTQWMCPLYDGVQALSVRPAHRSLPHYFCGTAEIVKGAPLSPGAPAI